MKLAIFDFDGTLFQKETLPYILKFWGKNKYPKVILIKTYIRILSLYTVYKLKLNSNMDKELFRAKASNLFLRLFENLDKEALIDFFKSCSQSMQTHFNTEVIAAIYEKKKAGYHTVICSGAYDLLLHEIKDDLPIDTIIATKLVFVNNHIDYKAPMTIITGANKTTALLDVFDHKKINWQDSYAYGDSYYDYKILSLTGNPVAVTPDAQLRSIAEEKNWQIIS